MRESASEKLERIRLVEGCSLSIRRTRIEIGLPHSTFSAWYKRSLEGGPEALEDRKPRCRSVWNRIPERIRTQVIETALVHTELSPRELACRITDREGEFLSESSVRCATRSMSTGIHRLRGKVHERGRTLIPLELYFERGRAKVELALARGKKRHDKREAIAKRESDRHLQRVTKREARRRSQRRD